MDRAIMLSGGWGMDDQYGVVWPMWRKISVIQDFKAPSLANSSDSLFPTIFMFALIWCVDFFRRQ